MGRLDPGVLTPKSAEELSQALDVYCGRVGGEPDEPANWPFTGDPIAMPAHVQLSIARDSWEQEVPRIVETVHRVGFVAKRLSLLARGFPP
jgi:hypothetical protein